MLVVETKKVRKSYDRQLVLDDVNFEMYSGNSRDVVPVKPEIQVNSSSKTVTTNNGSLVSRNL